MIEGGYNNDWMWFGKSLEFRVVGLKPGGLVCPRGQSAQALGPKIVRNRDADFGSDHRPHGHLHIAFGHILMDAIVRKARETLVLLHGKDFGLIRLRCTKDRLRD